MSADLSEANRVLPGASKEERDEFVALFDDILRRVAVDHENPSPVEVFEARIKARDLWLLLRAGCSDKIDLLEMFAEPTRAGRRRALVLEFAERRHIRKSLLQSVLLGVECIEAIRGTRVEGNVVQLPRRRQA